jgi:YD repeat-containing protein
MSQNLPFVRRTGVHLDVDNSPSMGEVGEPNASTVDIMFNPSRNEGGGTVNDLSQWKVHGPVKTLRSESAIWDLERQDWQPAQHFSVASFRVDGAILAHDVHNPDGTMAHSRWLYDEAGRMAESSSWMNDGPIDKAVYVYDEGWRPIQTTHLGHDGTRTDLEACSYDADGRKTKVRVLLPHEAGSECSASNACGASIGYTIEGTDSAYSATRATTMTVTYDEKNRPAKVSFHDASHHPLSHVILMRDSTGRLLSEEMRQGERSSFQNYLDKALPEERERLAAMLKTALGDALSSTTYGYDPRGRLVNREHRMGNLGGGSTTYRYDDHDDPVEETIRHSSREVSFDESGNMHYTSERTTVHHNRLEYLYDAHENWTERIVSFRSESEPNFQRSNIERRMITYYSM